MKPNEATTTFHDVTSDPVRRELYITCGCVLFSPSPSLSFGCSPSPLPAFIVMSAAPEIIASGWRGREGSSSDSGFVVWV